MILGSFLETSMIICGNMNIYLDHLVRKVKLHDLGFSGIPYFQRWVEGSLECNGRAQLVCVDDAWNQIYPQAQVLHLVTSRSNHCPIGVQCHGALDRAHRPASARYEIFWERDTSLAYMLERAWGDWKPSDNLGSVPSSMKGVMNDLEDGLRQDLLTC